MREMKAGTVWFNDPLTDNDAGPFGGMKQSGIGRELGVEGLEAFQETKHVHIETEHRAEGLVVPVRRRGRSPAARRLAGCRPARHSSSWDVDESGARVAHLRLRRARCHPGSTSMPRTASSTTVTPNPSSTASSTVFFTQ